MRPRWSAAFEGIAAQRRWISRRWRRCSFACHDWSKKFPEIVELDLNPIIAMPAPKGVTLSTRECESRGQPEPAAAISCAERSPRSSQRSPGGVSGTGAGQTTVQVCG
jgi:hypothetical protein